MMIATSKNDENNDGDGATGDKVDNDDDSATGDGATGYNDNDDDGGGTTGDKVDNYVEGARGNDDDDDGKERHNNQIEAMTRQVATIVIGVQWRRATTTRTMRWVQTGVQCMMMR